MSYTKNQIYSFKSFIASQKTIIVESMSLQNLFDVKSTRSILKSIKTLAKIKRCDYKIFFQNESKETIKWARKLFPEHGRNITQLNNKTSSQNLTIFDSAYNNNFKTIIVCADDLMEDLVRFNGKKRRDGYFLFESIQLKSFFKTTTERRPKENEVLENFSQFRQALTEELSYRDSVDFFNYLRTTSGLDEMDPIKEEINSRVGLSLFREQYIRGNMFKIGDSVRLLKDSKEEYVIRKLGTNYLIIAESMDSVIKKRVWINDVERVL